jgi:hypothetical protein
MGMFELNLGLREHNPPIVEDEYFYDVDARETAHIHTTIPPNAYILKDQQLTFWQKVKKFFM